MAAWGMGDPRWLVQDREDGSNVGGWHWEERNRLSWTKERLAQLLASELPPAQVDPAQGHARVVALKDCTGEAYQTMRKGNKKFAVYDLALTMDWSGRWLDDDTEVKGTISVTEFCSTNDPDEYLISVSASKEDDAHKKMQAAVQESLRPAIMERLAQYVQELDALPLQQVTSSLQHLSTLTLGSG